MKPVASMVAASVAVWLAAVAIADRRTSIEVLCGMLGPLAMACGSWVLMERTYRLNPSGLTAMMAGAFLAKMLFFGAYVIVMLVLLRLRPAPFVASFASYLIALYLVEALYLRRLFSGRS